ncbi:MAG: protein translocase subunit SecD [Sphingomonadales bacterium]|jgi:preprotein translocase subunit SecD|nr:protein translocase subunit SecD [Sphingomonadales bacterium]MBK9003112.1 protein translocase subunit SecD [Sphingomonadales bacterium]MBK9268360.1 protein translocase subunit SecD [Sphingomonadales bacterium]MBP6435213.1 protein translocase subunit SecD [Sphingorhabdus sp.]
MLDFPRWRVVMLNALIVLSILLAIPSFLPKAWLDRIPDGVPKETISLGLDLAGGSHILLEADTAQLARDRLESLEDSVRTAMRRAEPRVSIDNVTRTGGKLSFVVPDSAQIDAAREALLPITANSTGGRDWTIEVTDGNRITLSPAGAGNTTVLDQAMNSAKDVIDRRINALGTLEPTIIRQGADRIVVQVPGLQDPQALKDLIGKTAKLEFKLVDEGADPEQTAQGKARVGSQVLPYPDNPTGIPYIAVRRLGGIAGDRLTGAQQSFDQQDNQPVVNIQFDGEGGQRFARMTQQNTGKLFAIILDGQVISAPRINEPILGGSSQISGSFTVESANQLAIALNSGALPVDLKVVEERSVGPDLGADSIRSGVLAALIGTAGVLLWMVLSYGRFGVYASYALIINVAMILAVMALFNATLTLPGIAGFVLTIGAAVDANVLINERIREERRKGRRVIQALENGYKEASRAIFDANITNVIAAVLLFIFGSGPIRGFAVVLMIGIVTSVFTAVTLTRMWVAGWVKRARPQDLNI